MSSKRIILIRNAQFHDFGGGERFPIFVAEQLKACGYEPIIISRSPKLIDFAKDHSIKTINGPWWRWQNWSGWRVGLFPLYLIWQVVLLAWYTYQFKMIRPDAVHIQSKDDFIAATLAAKRLGVRVVWTDHADLKHIWYNLTIWYKNPIGKLVYYAAHKTDAITVVSKSEFSLVTANLPQNSKITSRISIVYNGAIDMATSYPVTNMSTPTFCVASRLVKDKGIGDVIDAFGRVVIKHPNATLTILGDGPDRELFQRQAKAITGITLMGHQKNPLLYIAQAAIFVHPSYHEGFSVALVEASMLRRAIIATNVGGNPEIIIDNQTGLLVPAKDPDTLASAMLRLVEDSTLAYELGKSARAQFLERFEFSRIVKEQFLPLYTGDLR